MDIKSAVKFLREEFPGAEVGLDNFRPYAKTKEGELFGILFDENHAGNQHHIQGPSAIIKFPAGKLSNRNWIIIKDLVSREQALTRLN